MSRHPSDILIRSLLENPRSVTRDVIERISEHVASASFSPVPERVAMQHRGLEYMGRTLSDKADPLHYHLVKRVVEDGQWTAGTTEMMYLEDLRQAVRAADSRLAVYRRRGGALVASISPNHLPPEHLGPRSEASIVVIYSADRGMIVSCYQASSLASVALPEDVIWLK